MVTSHISVRLARMSDCQNKGTETQVKTHKIEKPSESLDRAESGLFRELPLKVLALSQAELWSFSMKNIGILLILVKY